MAKTKKKTAKKRRSASSPTGPSRRAARAPANGRHVTVRMYNVGFGDAFLVSIPQPKGERRILFDCGSIEAAPAQTMRQVVDRIIADVTDPDGVPRIDVVVATHRHKDHVSGFALSGWEDVVVQEVWMPWTEDPADANARRIRDTQSRLALALDVTLSAKAGAKLGAAEKAQLDRYRDVVSNALMLSNDKAMKTLHKGFEGEPRRRFLPPEAAAKQTFASSALPGVKVHVMGPSRDPEVIRDMDPPKGRSFLRLHSAAQSAGGMLPAPFASEFREPTYTGGGTLPAGDLEIIQQAGAPADLAVAVALDKAVNGTSLMLMLEVSGTFLLFPGDAQWGTWNAALSNPRWKDMLEQVAFYKVGHHGSHNATPKDFVEQVIPDGIRAMASTLEREVWPDIPRMPLLQGLAKKKAAIARSDRPKSIDKAFRVDNGVIEARIAL